MHSDNFKPLSYLRGIPWAAFSSLNHKVRLWAACESAHTLRSFLHVILKVNKEDTVQVLLNGGGGLESIFIPEQAMAYMTTMTGGGIWEVPSFKSQACLCKHMAVIGTRVKKFHFGVKAIVTLGTAKAAALPAPMKWNSMLCNAVRKENSLWYIAVTHAES